jgi:ABC-type transport system involved in multi-copper enzyme maturation permease subunit
MLYLFLLVAIPALIGLWSFTFGSARSGWEAPAILGNVVLFSGLGAFLYYVSTGVRTTNLAWSRMFSICCWTVVAILLIYLVVEYVVLRLLGLSRIGAIVRVTYYESLLQPFSLIVILVGVVVVSFFGIMPFYTITEDPKMYRDVASSFLLLFPLILLIFASGKVIDEEIENRTMLTLMSKPIARWQVIVGKYLGVVLLVGVALLTISFASIATAYIRYFDDMRIDIQVANGPQLNLLYFDNFKACLGMVPITVLTFLQLATLGAISVAISTRYGLVLNMTLIVLLYIGANMTRFIPDAGISDPWKGIAIFFSYLLPYLSNFDLNQRLVYGSYRWDAHDTLGGSATGIPTFAQVWQYVGIASIYAACYCGAWISLATVLFRTRELT